MKSEINGSTAELERLELKIAKLLRYGVIVAGVLIFIGWMLDIQFEGNPLLAYHTYESTALQTQLHFAWLTGNHAELVGFAGLFILISLPILRVLLTAILFTKQKDYWLAGIAYFVFIAIAVSCALGLEL